MTTTELVRYDAMCTAIAECHRIDEVKDLRDKAMALELYAKQARNTDAERKASEVRLRAERRTGELLKDLARADTARGGDLKSAPKRAEPIAPSPYAKALADTGISTQAASRYHGRRQEDLGPVAVVGRRRQGGRLLTDKADAKPDAEPRKRPASQYYWGEWLNDPALQSCPLAARGMWHEMNCIMHSCEPYGHLYRNGKPMTVAQIATLVRIGAGEAKRYLAELEDAGVFSRDANGAIFSRRMVRDEALRNARAVGGLAGAEHGAKGAKHGVKGGRPVGSRGDKKPPLVENGKPPPSSSSSTSLDTPHTPQGGRTAAVGLKAWLAEVKARGELPIPEDDPVFVYAEEVGLPVSFLRLAWVEFRHRYSQPDAKRYRDWRSVYRKAVRGNWLKLWWRNNESDSYELTTAGHQAQRANEGKKAA